MGTPDSLLAASNYIQVVEKRQGLKVACIEEMAWRMGFINASQFEKAILRLPQSEYRQYLHSIFEESA
jgi:glucose-1-phosphate thymidylyltransferase